MATYIDWQQARRTALALTKPGPGANASDVEGTVDLLHQVLPESRELAHETTGLRQVGQARELVVDRATWIDLNIATMKELIDTDDPSNPARSITAFGRGTTTGLVFAFLAGRVLGQYDPFREPTLMLVAPSILDVQWELNLPAKDFALWVAVHEQTHRLQFANAPWLTNLILDFADDLMGENLAFDPSDLKTNLPTLRQSMDQGNPVSLAFLEAFMSERGWEKFQEISALMSILEGHADVIMDRVGDDAIQGIDRIRAAFDARRQRKGIRRLVNRLTGMSIKLAQYRDGARFCEHVIDEGGLKLLNKVFISRGYLPSFAELHDPASWVQRVG